MSARPWRVEYRRVKNIMHSWIYSASYATSETAKIAVRQDQPVWPQMYEYRLVNRDTAEVINVPEVSDASDRINP